MPMPMWIQRVVPNLVVLLGYRREGLRGDLLAGMAVAARLVLQVMAYAEIAGLPAVTGLVAACGALTCYAVAVFGSSRQLSVVPESTTALLSAVAIAPLAAGDPARYAVLAAGLVLVAGVLCLSPGWSAPGRVTARCSPWHGSHRTCPASSPEPDSSPRSARTGSS